MAQKLPNPFSGEKMFVRDENVSTKIHLIMVLLCWCVCYVKPHYDNRTKSSSPWCDAWKMFRHSNVHVNISKLNAALNPIKSWGARNEFSLRQTRFECRRRRKSCDVFDIKATKWVVGSGGRARNFMRGDSLHESVASHSIEIKIFELFSRFRASLIAPRHSLFPRVETL